MVLHKIFSIWQHTHTNLYKERSHSIVFIDLNSVHGFIESLKKSFKPNGNQNSFILKSVVILTTNHPATRLEQLDLSKNTWVFNSTIEIQ